MPCRNGAIARALAVAGLALLVAVSCPNPIDDDLLLVVEDDITPSMVISEPLPNSYYHGDVTVTGTLADSSQRTGDGKGRLLTLSFSVSDASTLDRTVTFEADGNSTVEPAGSSFDWDPDTGAFSFSFPSEDLYGSRILTFVARDLNGNESRQQIALQQYPFGPNLQLISPIDFSIYEMEVINQRDRDRHSRRARQRPTRCGRSSGRSAARAICLTRWSSIRRTPPPDGSTRPGTFTFNPSDGSFYDMYDCSGDSSTLILIVTAWNVNNSTVRRRCSCCFNGTGPTIVLAPRQPATIPRNTPPS